MPFSRKYKAVRRCRKMVMNYRPGISLKISYFHRIAYILLGLRHDRPSISFQTRKKVIFFFVNTHTPGSMFLSVVFTPPLDLVYILTALWWNSSNTCSPQIFTRSPIFLSVTSVSGSSSTWHPLPAGERGRVYVCLRPQSPRIDS